MSEAAAITSLAGAWPLLRAPREVTRERAAGSSQSLRSRAAAAWTTLTLAALIVTAASGAPAQDLPQATTDPVFGSQGMNFAASDGVTAPEVAVQQIVIAPTIEVNAWEHVSWTRYAAVNARTFAAPRAGAEDLGTLVTGTRVTIDRTDSDGKWARLTSGGWVQVSALAVADPTYVPPAAVELGGSGASSSSTGAAGSSTARQSPPDSSASSSSRVFTHHVYASGAGTSQDLVDACKGAVQTVFSTGVSIAEHRHCGGAWVLGLNVGDTVKLTGVAAGTYTVVATKSVPVNGPASVLDGKTWLQTCWPDGDRMRLVQVVKQ
ncbi:MAG: hypothetical protein ACK5MR_10090 [Cumulibacter sp.]